MEEERKTSELEETAVVEVDPKRETIHFPWAMAIVIAVLMALIIGCFIVVMILGPVNPVTSSSQNSLSSL